LKCRFCKKENDQVVIDLGFSPPSNSYVTINDLSKPEIYFPLKLFKCKSCNLVQTFDIASEKLFFSKNYAYLSSTSKTWLDHSKLYVDHVINEFSLTKKDLVIEIASNDGYLLKNFKKYKIPTIGIEPTLSTAKIAKSIGIKTITKFFTYKLAKKLVEKNIRANLIIANNVLAHVPDINDFVKGIKILLSQEGTITIEFPHLLNLIKNNQFDTIYHEHFSYLSLNVVNQIFKKNKLKIFKTEKISTHGGSLRVFVTHSQLKQKIDNSVNLILKEEIKFKLDNIETYKLLKNNIMEIKHSFINFLIKAKKNNKKVIGYGAAAKANTILNFFGIKNDMVDFIFDNSKYKYNKYMPGSHIPIIKPSNVTKYDFDYVIIFPWNIKEEIIEFFKKQNIAKKFKFVVLIPKFKIY
jgi:hypothetical protein